MSRVLFAPFSIVGGLLAGLVATRVFAWIWGRIDDQEPPESGTRDAQLPRLLAALVLQGAIFRLARGLADRGSRKGFYRLTGSWPGEKEPDPA